MTTFRILIVLTLARAGFLAPGLAAAPAPSAAEAEQLRIVQTMSAQLRARINELPTLIPADHPVGEATDLTVRLNRTPVVVEGQRFDGVVVTAPAVKATFAWAFAPPPNVASWYILREEGEMKGFADFLRRPRTALPAAAGLKPEDVATVTLQKLDAAAWSPEARYILWFRFKDEVPAESSLRAGFFAIPSTANHRLPALLFPPPSK